MSIVTITLNPAIDKTIYCDYFEIGATNRIQKSVEDIAGKGINVSKNLRVQLLESTIVAVFAGVNGKRSYESLIEDNFQVVEIIANQETRINQKIVDQNGMTTELNEQGPLATEETIRELYNWIDSNAKSGDIYVLSGSVPRGMPVTIYKDLILKLKHLGVKTLLDASKECLIEGLSANPFCVKPNIDEIQTLLKIDTKPTHEEMISYAKKLNRNGVEIVAISLGKEGAYFVKNEKVIKGKGLKLSSQSSVGAGDAMVSALAYSIYHDESLEELAIRAIATSGAAVETVGTKPGSFERVNQLMNCVEIEKGE